MFVLYPHYIRDLEHAQMQEFPVCRIQCHLMVSLSHVAANTVTVLLKFIHDFVSFS